MARYKQKFIERQNSVYVRSMFLAPEKGAGNLNLVRNRVLESFSNIFFTLAFLNF